MGTEVCMFIKFKSKFKSRIGKNSLFSILDQILSIGINFLLAILFARYLGATALGQYTLGISLVGILMIVTNFGINAIMSREIAKSQKKVNLYLGNALAIKFLISFPLLLILTILFSFILEYKMETIYLICLIAIYSSLTSAISYIGTALVSLHSNVKLVQINIFNKLFSLIFAFIALSYGLTLHNLLYIFIIISIAAFSFSLFQIKSIVSDFKIRFDYRFSKKYILISFPLIFAATAEFINLRIDTIFIGTILNEKSVGFYSAAYNIFMGATLIPLALTKVYFPNFIDYCKTDKSKAFILFHKYNYYFFVYSVSIGIIFYFLADLLIVFLYGESFTESINIIRYLSFALVVIVSNRLYNYTLVALKEQNYYFKITIFAMILNLILNYFLIHSVGILGAVYATIATEFTIALLGLYRIRKIVNV